MARKDMGFSKVKFFDPKKVKQIAAKHITIFYKRIEQGRDYQGQKLPTYSDSYVEIIFTQP